MLSSHLLLENAILLALHMHRTDHTPHISCSTLLRKTLCNWWIVTLVCNCPGSTQRFFRTHPPTHPPGHPPTHWKGGGISPPTPPRGAKHMPSHGPPNSKCQLQMAFVTDSNRPQLLWQPPPTAYLTTFGAASEVPSLLMHPPPPPPPVQWWHPWGRDQPKHPPTHPTPAFSGSPKRGETNAAA